jgi:hypothetical protein
MATTEEKLDKIIRVVTRTEVQVQALMEADAHTRLTKLETIHKFWRTCLIAVPGFGGLTLGLLKILDKI